MLLFYVALDLELEFGLGLRLDLEAVLLLLGRRLVELCRHNTVVAV